MVLYGLLFAGVHLGVSLAYVFFVEHAAPVSDPSGVRSFALILIAALITGLRFVDARERLYSKREMWQLIFMGFGYLAVVKGLLLIPFHQQLEDLTLSASLGLVGMALIWDFLMVFVSFKFTVIGLMKWHLEKQTSE